MEKVDLNSLTPEQKTELLQQFANEKKQKDSKRKSEQAVYQHLKDTTVRSVFERLQLVSAEMERTKAELLQEFTALLEMKNELYKVKEKQLSHSWTTADGEKTVITGFNTIDRWDETITVGIAKVNEWLEKQMSDTNSNLVGMIRELLKPNKDGVLKANRVLDLQNQADKIGDTELIEAVRLIREAHRPDKTSTYIKAKFKDEDGITRWLGLSMSSV